MTQFQTVSEVSVVSSARHGRNFTQGEILVTNPVVGILGEDEGTVVRTFASRFGEVMIDISKAITFPRGLLGMPDRHLYALAEFPSTNMQQFKLLQSLDDSTLSFITLPIEVQGGFVEEQDILQVANNLGIALSDLAVLLIVSVHRTPEGTRISVNTRAPIFIDAATRKGVQFVFHNDKYKVQQYLG